QDGRLTLSSAGAWAVAWRDPTVAPSSGAEGIFTLINVARARTNPTATDVVLERPGGYRITNVVFRIVAGRATQVSVFAKSTISTLSLSEPIALLPTRVSLPPSMSVDVTSREVVSNATGDVVMLRSTTSPELAS